MDKIKVSEFSCSVERPVELCTGLLLDAGDGKCVLCGRPMNQSFQTYHPGPQVTVHGSFEMTEHLEPSSIAFSGLRLCDLDDSLDADQGDLTTMSIAVVGCEPIETGRYRYRFSGSMINVEPKCLVESP